MAAQAVQLVFAQVDPVHEDRTRGNVVEARDQVRKRRFAAARGSYERHGLALADREADRVDHLARIVVRERHVAELDTVAELFQPDGSRRFGDAALLVEQSQHAVARGDALVDVAEGVGERAHRARNLCEDGEVGDEPGRFEPSVQHEAAAVEQQHGRGRNAEEFAHRRSELLAPRHRARDARVNIVDFAEFTGNVPRRVVALDHFDAGERLVQQAGHVAEVLLRLFGRLAQPFDDRTDEQCRERQEDRREDRQFPRDFDQRDHVADNQERFAEGDLQRVGDAELHDGDVRSDLRDDVALAFVAEVAHVQAHHVVEHRVAQAAQRVDLHVFDGPLAQVAEHVAQQGRRDDEDAQEEHHVHHRVVGAVDFVEQEVDQPVEVVHVQREGGHRGDLCDLLRGVEQRVEDRDDHHEIERVEQRVEERVKEVGYRVFFDRFGESEQSPVGVHRRVFIGLSVLFSYVVFCSGRCLYFVVSSVFSRSFRASVPFLLLFPACCRHASFRSLRLFSGPASRSPRPAAHRPAPSPPSCRGGETLRDTQSQK